MQAKNVYEALLEMVRFEQNFGAYWIYLALKRGYLQKHEPVSRMYDVPFTEAEVAEIYEMDRRDVLGINRIKLYATSVGNGSYAFYFAELPDYANDLHRKIYKRDARKWHSVYNQHRHTVIFDEVTQKNLMLSEIKEQAKVFPYYVGEWGG